LPPSGTAGGDLTGSYPNPTINTGTVTTTKLADNSVTTSKIVDASVTSAKLAAGVIPTSLPPNGTAGGDLTGSYPNPLVSKIQNIGVSNTVPTNGQVLKFNGTQWGPAAESGGSFTLPYSASASNAANLMSLTNTGTGSGLEGINSSTNANAFGVIGKITSVSSGASSSGIRGINSGTGTNGTGIWGTHNGMEVVFLEQVQIIQLDTLTFQMFQMHPMLFFPIPLVQVAVAQLSVKMEMVFGE
jgi:hypothetical protein